MLSLFFLSACAPFPYLSQPPPCVPTSLLPYTPPARPAPPAALPCAAPHLSPPFLPKRRGDAKTRRRRVCVCVCARAPGEGSACAGLAARTTTRPRPPLCRCPRSSHPWGGARAGARTGDIAAGLCVFVRPPSPVPLSGRAPPPAATTPLGECCLIAAATTPRARRRALATSPPPPCVREKEGRPPRGTGERLVEASFFFGGVECGEGERAGTQTKTTHWREGGGARACVRGRSRVGRPHPRVGFPPACRAGPGLPARAPPFLPPPPKRKERRETLPAQKKRERLGGREREKNGLFRPRPKVKRCANANTKNKKGNEFVSGEVVAGRLVCTRRAESGEVLRGEV